MSQYTSIHRIITKDKLLVKLRNIKHTDPTHTNQSFIRNAGNEQ
jgi:hypothetical protein